MIQLLFSLVAFTTTTPADVVRTFHVVTTDVSGRLSVPNYRENPEVLKAIAKKYGEGALLIGQMDPDANIRMLAFGGYAASAKQWRDNALGHDLVGAGQFDVGQASCSEHVHEGTPPYAEITRRAFFSLPGGCVEIDVNVDQKGDDVKFSKDDFAHFVNGLHFAIVRHGGYDDLPARYRDLSHEACVRPDALAWLTKQIADGGDDWIPRFVLAEYTTSVLSLDFPSDAHVETADAGPLYTEVLAKLDAKKQLTHEESYARMLALDGLALATSRAGALAASKEKPDAAADKSSASNKLFAVAKEKFAAALALAIELDPKLKPDLMFDLACICAAAKDPAGTAEALKPAADASQMWLVRAARHPIFASVISYPEVTALFPPPPKRPPKPAPKH